MSETTKHGHEWHRNRWGEHIHTLEDFAKDGVDVTHPLTGRRIPVLHSPYPRFNFHVAVVIGGDEHTAPEHHGLEPEPHEVEQLCAYLERQLRIYTKSHRARVSSRGPFDVDATVSTHILRKHPTRGWQYNLRSWRHGPTWFPSPPQHTAGPFTLEELLDDINTTGDGPPSKAWLDLKDESGAFSAQPGDPRTEG